MNFDSPAVAAPTRALVNWIAESRCDDLPQRTRELVPIAKIDTLGAGICGMQDLVDSNAARLGAPRRHRERDKYLGRPRRYIARRRCGNGQQYGCTRIRTGI